MLHGSHDTNMTEKGKTREKTYYHVVYGNCCTSLKDCKGKEVKGETEGVRSVVVEDTQDRKIERQKTRNVDGNMMMLETWKPNPKTR